jgi:hypothetical protein
MEMIVRQNFIGQASFAPWAPSFIGPGPRGGQTAFVMQAPGDPEPPPMTSAAAAGAAAGAIPAGASRPAPSGAPAPGISVGALVLFGASAVAAAVLA